MQIVTEIKPEIVLGSSIAVGFFDGVHKGHQAVINHAVNDAARLGVKACVVTFKEHPRLVIEGKTPKLLTSLQQRLCCFEQSGVDITLALPFSHQVSNLGAEDYVQLIFIKAMGVKSVSVGYNHHFAHNREGTPAKLLGLGEKYNFQVHITEKVYVEGIEVSSSRIRKALKEGDLKLATKMLGRPYAIAGEVVVGQGLGRSITGFPTANLKVTEHQLIPLPGVYAAMTKIDGKRYMCAVNIGCRPTLTYDSEPTIEAHILNFDENVYGKELEVELWEYLRPEQNFKGIDELKEQINKDCLKVNELTKCGLSTYC